MKKIYLLLALLCVALVACERQGSVEESMHVDKVDKEILSLEKLIAQQNGNFDDEKLFEKLLKSTIVMERMYLMNDKGAWEFDWEYDSNKVRSEFRSHYIFSEDTFTVNSINDKTKIRRYEDIYYFTDYDYAYDAETNVLTTYCSYSYDDYKISVGEKQEATVVYFDGDMLVLDGYILGNDISRGSMYRSVFKFDKETRDQIICLDKYIDEPQDVDSKAIFEKMENYAMCISDGMVISYLEENDMWTSSGVAGNFMNSFRLKGDIMEFRSVVLGEVDGEYKYHDVYYERLVVRDVENDALYTTFEVPDVGVKEETFKIIFDNGEYVIWRYDIVYNNFDKEPTEDHLILVCSYE